jgi:hypothetical protein
MGFIGINNKFLMGLNPRVSVYNRNSFEPDHDDSLIIEVDRCWIIDPYIIHNMFVALF